MNNSHAGVWESKQSDTVMQELYKVFMQKWSYQK